MYLDISFLPQTSFVFMLVFARMGAMVMAMPGIGDRSVPVRVRLIFALALTFVLYPVLGPEFTVLPPALNAIMGLFFIEILVGLAIGLALRLITAGLHFAGSIIAFQAGLAFAMSFDPSENAQNTLVSTFLSMLSIVLIFSADLHHLLIIAMHDSYALLSPGDKIPAGDFIETALGILKGAFIVAIQLAAPFLVFGLIFYLGVGILSRLIPQVQIFFVAMPANILASIILLMLMLSTMMLWYLDYYAAAISPLISGG
jgi:flagellar biosynthetic protein FliR